MTGEITKIIKEKSLKPKDCEYHTLRTLENGGRIQVLVIKGDSTAHIDLTCPHCGHSAYYTQEYKKVSKAAKIRMRVECEKCKKKIPIDKLKSKKSKKK